MTTWGCTPGFLRKSAQPVGSARDRCDSGNERARKCLKIRRDECEELVARASEQREEKKRGGGPGQVCAQVSQTTIALE